MTKTNTIAECLDTLLSGIGSKEGKGEIPSAHVPLGVIHFIMHRRACTYTGRQDHVTNFHSSINHQLHP